jgi:hypothetical protein
MTVKEREKTETRTVATRRATVGAPQRMQEKHAFDDVSAPPPSLAELQERQSRKRPTRRPTRSYNEAPPEPDEESVPDVPPTNCD